MILEIGRLALILSYVFLLPLVARTQHQKHRLLYIHWVCLILALMALFLGFAMLDPNMAYVRMHSAPGMSLYYRLSALWSGHSGSLLLMFSILATWVVVTVRFSTEKTICFRRYAMLMGGLLTIQLLFNNPFIKSETTMGFSGLNPLLQDFGMMIHPPILYIGYVASVVPFLIVVSEQALGKTSLYWIKLTSMSALAILTLGITLGSWWAYRILGWGGYWAWDPVENASLLPWLLQLALLHAVIANQRRMIEWLSILGFVVTLIATTLVRSGSMVSVHSFMKQGAILQSLGMFSLGLLVYAVYHRRDTLFQPIPIPKPFTFHFYIVLLTAGFLLLTLILPLLFGMFQIPLVFSEALFVKVAGYIGIACTMALSYYLKPQLKLIGMGAMGIACVGYLAGDMMTVTLLAFVVMALMLYYARGYKNIAHIGFLCFIGFVCLNHLQSYSVDIMLAEGESQQIHNHTITLLEIKDKKSTQFIEKQAVMKINDDILKPAIRYFPLNDTAVAISDTLLYSHWEWYTVLGALTDEGLWSISIHQQYWVRWIWLSGILMVIGIVRTKRNLNQEDKDENDSIKHNGYTQ